MPISRKNNLITIISTLLLMFFASSCDSLTGEIESNKELTSNDISFNNQDPTPIGPDPDPSHYELGEMVGCKLRKTDNKDIKDETLIFANKYGLTHYEEGIVEGWNNCQQQGTSSCTTTTYINPVQAYVIEFDNFADHVFSFNPNSPTIEITCNYYAF